MLTKDQIAQYHEDGYTLASGLFTEAELDRLEAEFDGIIERRLANQAQLHTSWKGEWNRDGGTTLIHTHDVQAYSAEWTKLLVHDRFTEAMADCLGTDNVQLHHTKLFQKPTENGSGFPMHQDTPYFPHEKHTMMAGIIHLSDADEQMGCVRVVPGSHKLGLLDTVEGHKHLDPEEYPLEDALPCPAKRGDVLFFNYLTIHGSGANKSDRIRKTVLVQVRDAADKPTVNTHRSHAQGMMLRGINPLSGGAASADGTLETGNAAVVNK